MKPVPPAGDDALTETRIDGEPVFDGKLLHVRRDRVRLPDGGEATREYIVHPGAVMIVPRLADGRYVMARQFRYPLGRVFLEFPAGKIDPGEAPLDTARRELQEEAGYAAAQWRRLGVIHPVISYSTEFIELWQADALTPVGSKLDDGEFLEIVMRSHDELLAAFDRGEITDSKTVAGLFLLDRQRRQ
ncbi:MAG: NUDIX hydrolase [Betaproteobacteria bacterium]